MCVYIYIYNSISHLCNNICYKTNEMFRSYKIIKGQIYKYFKQYFIALIQCKMKK